MPDWETIFEPHEITEYDNQWGRRVLSRKYFFNDPLEASKFERLAFESDNDVFFSLNEPILDTGECSVTIEKYINNIE